MNVSVFKFIMFYVIFPSMTFFKPCIQYSNARKEHSYKYKNGGLQIDKPHGSHVIHQVANQNRVHSGANRQEDKEDTSDLSR